MVSIMYGNLKLTHETEQVVLDFFFIFEKYSTCSLLWFQHKIKREFVVLFFVLTSSRRLIQTFLCFLFQERLTAALTPTCATSRQEWSLRLTASVVMTAAVSFCWIVHTTHKNTYFMTTLWPTYLNIKLQKDMINTHKRCYTPMHTHTHPHMNTWAHPKLCTKSHVSFKHTYTNTLHTDWHLFHMLSHSHTHPHLCIHTCIHTHTHT